MVNKKTSEKQPYGYIVLWIIVVVLVNVTIIHFGINEAGKGRWECIEYETSYSIYCKGTVQMTGEEPCVQETLNHCSKEAWIREVDYDG